MKINLLHDKKLLIIFELLLFSKISLGQVTFLKTYGDSITGHINRGYTVTQTEDDGYIAAGERGYYVIVGQPNQLFGEVYIVKTDKIVTQYGLNPLVILIYKSHLVKLFI
jgi:hypothetical protein